MSTGKEHCNLIEKEDLIGFLNATGISLAGTTELFKIELFSKISFFVAAYILQKLLKGLEFENLN